MVQPVRADHEPASNHGDRYLPGVRRKLVTKPCRSRDAAQSSQNQEQDGAAPVSAEAGDQRDCAEQRNQNGETAMHALIRRKKVGKDRRK